MEQEQTFLIEGMSCGHCVGAVKQALGALPGVRVVAVEVGRAVLSAEPPVARDAVSAALDGAGFSLRP